MDASLGKVVDKLKSKGLLEDTLIIVASKHGQAPIDPTKHRKIAPKAVTNATKVEVAFQTVSHLRVLEINIRSLIGNSLTTLHLSSSRTKRIPRQQSTT